MTQQYWEDCFQWVHARFGHAVSNKIPDVFSSDLRRGGIVGQARCDAVLRPNGSAAPSRSQQRELGVAQDLRWHMQEQYGFVLADVISLPFRPCVGRPRWFH